LENVIAKIAQRGIQRNFLAQMLFLKWVWFIKGSKALHNTSFEK